MIEIKNLTKTFSGKDGSVHALKNISVTINDGDIYGIIGMSGAGKSTLVRCINMITRPTSGEIIIDGVDVTKLPEKELRNVRKQVAMIFQSFNLLMQRTCLANICFPLEISGVDKASAEKRARELLELVGLPDKANSYPAQLSGGQQQRIAIARALATNPKVLLCDEATSALDPRTTNQILDLIADINKKMGITVVVITHQMSVVEKICNKVSILDAGTVAETGEVTEIFGNPKSEAAKRLVFPDRSSDKGRAQYKRGRSVISVSFNDAEATDTPLIARLAREKGVEASILFASTRSVGSHMFGKMLLGVDEKGDNVKTTLDYLNAVPRVNAEIVPESEIDDAEDAALDDEYAERGFDADRGDGEPAERGFDASRDDAENADTSGARSAADRNGKEDA
ncbi:MAG: methionine ABC transporter ATP-binding protein [Eubacterium sp.]|jgi:D-methionine transport system ATP-binding protein